MKKIENDQFDITEPQINEEFNPTSEVIEQKLENYSKLLESNLILPFEENEKYIVNSKSQNKFNYDETVLKLLNLKLDLLNTADKYETIGKNVKTAILEIKPKTHSDCSSYDPFGLYKINDCLQCENCAYQILFENGLVMKTDDFEKYPMISEYDKYLLEFINPVTIDLFSYLTDSKSDYRIIRIKDNVIMRYSKEKQLKKFGRVCDESDDKIDNSNRKRLVFKQK